MKIDEIIAKIEDTREFFKGTQVEMTSEVEDRMKALARMGRSLPEILRIIENEFPHWPAETSKPLDSN